MGKNEFLSSQRYSYYKLLVKIKSVKITLLAGIFTPFLVILYTKFTVRTDLCMFNSSYIIIAPKYELVKKSHFAEGSSLKKNLKIIVIRER